MMGMEAGQSAFGDVYAWFKNILSWPINQFISQSSLLDAETAVQLKKEISDKMIAELSKAAAALPLKEDDELAVDWLNGRRTPDANQLLKGALSGLNLGTTAPHLFKALAEATCFGAKAIVDRFNEQGVPVKGLDWFGRRGAQSSLHYANDGRCDEHAHPYSQIRTNLRCRCSNVCCYGSWFLSECRRSHERHGAGL